MSYWAIIYQTQTAISRTCIFFRVNLIFPERKQKIIKPGLDPPLGKMTQVWSWGATECLKRTWKKNTKNDALCVDNTLYFRTLFSTKEKYTLSF